MQLESKKGHGLVITSSWINFGLKTNPPVELVECEPPLVQAAHLCESQTLVHMDRDGIHCDALSTIPIHPTTILHVISSLQKSQGSKLKLDIRVIHKVSRLGGEGTASFGIIGHQTHYLEWKFYKAK